MAAVYRRAYLLSRPRLVAATGGGVSLRAVLAVATAHAKAADHRTGRSSRPLLGTTKGLVGLTAATGLGQRTVTRARSWLRLVGLATEVQGGRHRSFTERIASWERGDCNRGWTAEYALHPSMTYAEPVDNSSRVIAGQRVRGTPPPGGCFSTERSDGKVVTPTDKPSTDPASRGEDVAPRRASTKLPARDGSGTSKTAGTALMLSWRTSGTCPLWSRRYGAHRWSGALMAAATAGWTARDLDQLLVEVAAAGRPVLRDPRRPIAYLCHLLGLVDVAERPTALIDAQAAEDLARRQRHVATQLDRRDVDAAARAVAVTALTGAGRAAALTITQTAAAAATRRRSERASAERVALTEQVVRRRGR